ncbi:unnamed protein product [Mycena citricolor]|uniref:Uncharacterized protein n=1 Tax=Mycena citricolor TaxID=2018698 RepID=A0AAD2Q3J4_9AGAR|nr:unnamed protein product [Mycena citricolor]
MASNYKRHSMPVVPRPLQLANGATPSPSPLSASASYSIPPSPLAGSPRPGVQGRPPHKRRPSSIIYNPPTPTSRHARPLARSSSVGGERDRRTPTVERAPTTLAEKHADLLHFIAQKESKCLEMRSQLSVHEAELLQLKRKWERIVSRGFISPHNPSTPSLPSSNATVATAPSSNLAPTLSTPSSANTSLTSGSDLPTSANGAAVFDGVRAGVQGVRAGMEGVGRLIAASLPAVPFSPPAPSYFGPNAASPLRPEPPALQRSTSGKMHSARSSTSTNASSSTTSRFNSSTRLSQSSASSIEEETTPSLGETSSEQCDEDAWGSFADGDGEAGWTGGADHDDDPWGDLDVAEDDGGQILMVQDTGATPVVSPNPMFGPEEPQVDQRMAARRDGRGQAAIEYQDRENTHLIPALRLKLNFSLLQP